MKLSRPMMKFFGSKWQASKHYPPPLYDVIVEPFAGSACYSLHYPEHQVVLVDKDPDVVDLWRYLLTASVAEIRALPTDLEVGLDIRTLDIPRGAQLLIRNWQRVGRSACWTVSKWNNANSGMWHVDTANTIADNVQRMRHWTVLLGSYDELPNAPVTWFIDPPYQHVAPSYRRDIDCNTVDFWHLSQWCRERQGQTIVCEQQGADWLPFREFRKLKAGCAGTRVPGSQDTGVVWTNS
jgi:16S rRNA G966 N2-methylase RsmD